MLVSVFPPYQCLGTKETHIFDRKDSMAVPRIVLPLLLSFDILSPIATSIDCFVSDGLSPFHVLHLQLASRTLVQLAVKPSLVSVVAACPM